MNETKVFFCFKFVCAYLSLCVPYLDSVMPSKTAKPEVRLELALAISVPSSCFQCWDHNTTGGGPGNKGEIHKTNNSHTNLYNL